MEAGWKPQGSPVDPQRSPGGIPCPEFAALAVNRPAEISSCTLLTDTGSHERRGVP